MANKERTLALLSLITLFAGCTSAVVNPGSDLEAKAILADAPISGKVRFFAYLDVIREPKDGSQEINARFGRFDQAVPAAVVRDAFKLQAPDTCESSSRENPIKIVDELAFPGHPYQFVDAGDAVTINHRNRRYARLSRSMEQDGAVYESGVSGLAATVAKIKLFDVFVRTENLSVTIPGAVFPKMGPLGIPSVSDVDGFNLDPEDSVRADTVFEWDAGDNPGALVQISAGGGGRAIFCSAVDDGQFALPAKIRQWLGDNTIPNPEASRESVIFYQLKDALIAVSQSTQY